LKLANDEGEAGDDDAPASPGDFDLNSGTSVDFSNLCEMLVDVIAEVWYLDFEKNGDTYPTFAELSKEHPHGTYWLQRFLASDELSVENVMEYFTLPHHGIEDCEKVQTLLSAACLQRDALNANGGQRILNYVSRRNPETSSANLLQANEEQQEPVDDHLYLHDVDALDSTDCISEEVDFAHLCEMLVDSIAELWYLDFETNGDTYPTFTELSQEYPHSVYWLQRFLASDQLTVENVMEYFTLPHHGITDSERVQGLLNAAEHAKIDFFHNDEETMFEELPETTAMERPPATVPPPFLQMEEEESEEIPPPPSEPSPFVDDIFSIPTIQSSKRAPEQVDTNSKYTDFDYTDDDVSSAWTDDYFTMPDNNSDVDIPSVNKQPPPVPAHIKRIPSTTNFETRKS